METIAHLRDMDAYFYAPMTGEKHGDSIGDNYPGRNNIPSLTPADHGELEPSFYAYKPHLLRALEILS
jgi:hypothetical protein